MPTAYKNSGHYSVYYLAAKSIKFDYYSYIPRIFWFLVSLWGILCVPICALESIQVGWNIWCNQHNIMLMSFKYSTLGRILDFFMYKVVVSDS